MKETVENDTKEIPLICSICHKTKLNLKKTYSKFNKVFKDNLKDNDLSDLIKKCNCNNKDKIKIYNNNEIYVHKYCILIKIIYNFEIKCEKCNTLYNIKIDKKKDKNKKIFLFATFLIIYLIHLFIYLFCLFLLFINVILKEYIVIYYKHLCFFFAIILLFLNTIFLYFSINKNIQTCKKKYKYNINIFDLVSSNDHPCCINAENGFYKLLFEFYEWFYNQPMKNILTNINKKFINNKLHFFSINSIQKYIKENNIEIIQIHKSLDKNEKQNKNVPIINIKNPENQTINISKDKNITNNFDSSKNNILNLDSRYIIQNENDYSSIKSNPGKDVPNKIKPGTIIKKPSKNLSPNQDLHRTSAKDFINININQRASKNININIHFSSDKNSQTSSKEIIFQSFKKTNKIGKTAFIPKKLSMTNLMSEPNSFKRKRRQLKSIKIKPNNLYLIGSGISGNIVEDEEVDFSEFEKMESKLSKESKEKKNLFGKNDLELKNFRSKKSYKDIELNISNSDEKLNEEISGANLSLKNKITNKHVHFNAQGNT